MASSSTPEGAAATSFSIPIPQTLLTIFFAVVPEAYREWWMDLYLHHPLHLYIETTLILVIVYIMLKSPQADSKRSKREVHIDENVLKERLAAFNPEPLAPTTLSEEAQFVLQDMIIVDSAPNAARVTCKGKECVNFGSADFLDFGSSSEILKATNDALAKYGVGSCGPRGFYGFVGKPLTVISTIDAHVFLEEALAAFFHATDAIIYSDAVCQLSPKDFRRSVD